MKSTEVYSELIDIAKNLGIILRKVRGNFSSGICFVNEKPYILLNKIADIDANIYVLAK